MKKAAIIVCAAIYAIAIIVVAFLGYRAEINNPPIYADDIILVEDKFPYEHIENGVVVYTITEVAPLPPERSEEEEVEKEYKYEVKINEFEYLYEVLGAQLKIPAKPISFKVDEETGVQKEPDEKGLNYVINNKNVEVNNEGVVTFLKYKDVGSVDLIIKTKDTSNITIYVRIYWG